MARIRTIKPEFWTNERVMECSMAARLLFIGMWNFADDLGRLPLSQKTLKAQILPSDDVNSDTILGMVNELVKNGLLLVYTVDDREYLQIVGWHHQRIDKPQPGKCPAPSEGFSKIVRGTVATDRKGEEGKVEESNSEPIGSGADAPRDPRTKLFSEGLDKLMFLTGKGEDSCRAFIGKCLKAAQDEAVEVLAAIDDADRNRVANASAWISARLKAKAFAPSAIADKISMEEAIRIYDRTGNWSRFAPVCDPSQAPPDLWAKYGRLPDGRKMESA